MNSVDELRDFLNANMAAKEEPQPAVQDPAPTPEEPAATVTEDAAPQEVEVKAAEQTDKDNQAFAALRTNNKLMEDTLKSMADSLGIKFTDTNDLIAKVQENAIQKRAEQTGISAEILKRLDAQDRELAEYRAQREQNRITAGFQQLASKYGLSETELVNFARGLDQDKVDLHDKDIVNLYEARNMEAIIAKRVQDAVQEALAKDQQSTATATTPSAVGAAMSAVTGATIGNTVSDLRAFLTSSGYGRR